MGVTKSRTLLSDFHFNFLEEETASHSINLAWEIPETEESGGLQSMVSQRVEHDWAQQTTWESMSGVGYGWWRQRDKKWGIRTEYEETWGDRCERVTGRKGKGFQMEESVRHFLFLS